MIVDMPNLLLTDQHTVSVMDILKLSKAFDVDNFMLLATNHFFGNALPSLST